MDERRRTMQWQAWFADNATVSSRKPGKSWETPMGSTVRLVLKSAQLPCSDTSIPYYISISQEKRLAIEIPPALPPIKASSHPLQLHMLHAFQVIKIRDECGGGADRSEADAVGEVEGGALAA